MQVHFSLEQIPEISLPVVTMGSFDGVHAGHRVIIARLNYLAQRAGGESVLITFHPHPRKVLYPETAGKKLKLITTLAEKCRVMEETGLDHLVVLEFTKDFARTTPERFVEEYLVGKLHVHTIVVGFNHYFGHNKEGSFESLYRAREEYGFTVEEIPEQEIQNETVSSTKIRKAIAEGHIQRANAYLDHFYILKADMEYLFEESEVLGKSCFSLSSDDPNKLIPPLGSYAVSFFCKESQQKGLLRITPKGNYLFPLDLKDCRLSACSFLYFHKHLVIGEEELLEKEIKAVEELIY